MNIEESPDYETAGMVPPELIQTNHKKDAVYAFCPIHQTWITANPYWDLSTVIHMHLTGIGSETYARVRGQVQGVEWKPCQIRFYKWAGSDTI